MKLCDIGEANQLSEALDSLDLLAAALRDDGEGRDVSIGPAESGPSVQFASIPGDFALGLIPMVQERIRARLAELGVSISPERFQ